MTNSKFYTLGQNLKTKDEKYEVQIYNRFDDSIKIFTDEEIAEKNAKEVVVNEAGLELALADGFIELPIAFRNVEGELVDKKVWVHPSFTPSNSEDFFVKHGMDYNIYVPSYARAKNNQTGTMLTKFGATNWYFAIDPSQYEEYKKHWPIERFVLRDISFRDPSMVDLGTSRKRPNSMSGTSGIYNNLLALSRSLGEKKYWTMDDDIKNLAMKVHRRDGLKPGEIYNKDDYYRCSNIKEEYGFSFQKFMNSLEDVANTVRNHGFVGLEKFGTVFSLPVMWKRGTRVYSYYLSDNATQQAHKMAMNNDVIASLEQAKRGMPPYLFECISYNSEATQAGGGLTDQYKLLGTLEKGEQLVKAQPNFTKIVERYSRIHHSADFGFNNKIRSVSMGEGSDFRWYKARD